MHQDRRLKALKCFTQRFGVAEAIGDAFHITSDELLKWNDVYETLGRAFGAPTKPLPCGIRVDREGGSGTDRTPSRRPGTLEDLRQREDPSRGWALQLDTFRILNFNVESAEDCRMSVKECRMVSRSFT